MEKKKFGIPKEDGDYEGQYFEYGNVYMIEKTTKFERLVIGANENQIELIFNLAKELEPPLFVLYVLVVPRSGNEPGRYQSPRFETAEELERFLDEFKDFFETDGRHHVWVGNLENSGLFVYDQHNVIFAYGKIDEYIKVIKKKGFTEKEFWFPGPHIHYYNSENDKFEDALLKHFEWKIFPLKDEDEWN